MFKRLSKIIAQERIRYLLPGLIYLALLFLFPLGFVIFLSFHNQNLLRPDLGRTFAGISNYVEILGDPATWAMFGRTFYFIAGAIVTELLLGLLIALFLNREFRGVKIVRSIFLIPFFIAPVIVGFTWRFLLNPNYGPLPQIFEKLGLTFLTNTPVLANDALVIPILILVDNWQFLPFVVLVLLAGLKSLPTEPYEAAKVDGANAWQKFRHITLPLLKSSILVALAIRTITSIRLFDRIVIMTGGGPGTASEVLSFSGYSLAFQSYQFGRASVLGVIAAILAATLTAIYMMVIGAD